MTHPVIGPLYMSPSPSGINFPTCTHTAPDECPKCDGSRNTGTENEHRAVTPPCMREEKP